MHTLFASEQTLTRGGNCLQDSGRAAVCPAVGARQTARYVCGVILSFFFKEDRIATLFLNNAKWEEKNYQWSF